MSFTGPGDELRACPDAIEAAEGTEIMYGSMRNDVPSELRNFAEVAGL